MVKPDKEKVLAKLSSLYQRVVDSEVLDFYLESSNYDVFSGNYSTRLIETVPEITLRLKLKERK